MMRSDGNDEVRTIQANARTVIPTLKANVVIGQPHRARRDESWPARYIKLSRSIRLGAGASAPNAASSALRSCSFMFSDMSHPVFREASIRLSGTNDASYLTNCP